MVCAGVMDSVMDLQTADFMSNMCDSVRIVRLACTVLGSCYAPEKKVTTDCQKLRGQILQQFKLDYVYECTFTNNFTIYHPYYN